MVLGARINVALMDLGLLVQPRRLRTFTPDVKPTPWLGLVVLALLIAGLVFAGQGAVQVVGAVIPHRVERQ